MFNRAKYEEHISDHKYKDWQKISDPVASLKYDGGAYWLVFSKDGVPSFISRRESVKGGFPDKTSNIPHLSDFKIPELAGHIFNGELIHSGFSKKNVESHSAASGILNSLPEKAIKTQNLTGPLRYVIHDVINPEFTTYSDKIQHMKKLEDLVNKPDLLFTPKFYTDKKKIQDLLEDTQRLGREGIIVTSLSTPESTNRRIKLKNFYTYNLRIVKILQEFDKDGKPKESMGAVDVADATGKIVGRVGTGFSRNERIDAWNNPKNWMNRIIQVKTMGFAVNALRMPVYNGDADGSLDSI